MIKMLILIAAMTLPAQAQNFNEQTYRLERLERKQQDLELDVLNQQLNLQRLEEERHRKEWDERFKEQELINEQVREAQWRGAEYRERLIATITSTRHEKRTPSILWIFYLSSFVTVLGVVAYLVVRKRRLAERGHS
jgi:hypothetical protein